jgi:oligopeptide/dipeptide ABC transporter ATP-binding protein
VLSVFDELRSSGLGILMITHDLSTAVHHADRIAVMYLGRIVELGPAKDVVRHPSHPYTRALVAAVPRASRSPGRVELPAAEPPDPAAIPAGCRFRLRCPVAVVSCEHDDPPLFDVPMHTGHRVACPVTIEPDFVPPRDTQEVM